MTELKSALSRELTVGKAKHKLTVSPQGFKLVLKGKRNGLEIAVGMTLSTAMLPWRWRCARRCRLLLRPPGFTPCATAKNRRPSKTHALIDVQAT